MTPEEILNQVKTSSGVIDFKDIVEIVTKTLDKAVETKAINDTQAFSIWLNIFLNIFKNEVLINDARA